MRSKAFEWSAANQGSRRPARNLTWKLGLTVFLSAVVLVRVGRGQGIIEFPLPDGVGQPLSITAGPDGSLWFTEAFTGGNKGLIGRITTAGAVTEFHVPDYGAPADIATGPDGNLWYPDAGSYQGAICRITTTGDVASFPVPTAGGHPEAIVKGPDDALWFTEGGVGKIGRITTQGVVTEFALPTPDGNPRGIAAGKDGNLWFTEFDGNKIGRITTAGEVTEFEIPSAHSGPWKIAAGADGNLWFTENYSDRIGRITTDGFVTEFFTAGADMITAGADGNIWFSSFYEGIGRITTSGVISFVYGVYGSLGIAAGPDGNVWFTEPNSRKIGRTTASCAGTAATLCLNQSRFQLTVDWTVPNQGGWGHGTAVPLTGDTGYFWFFNSDNVELVVKVLDGTASNGHFWVFYGALSNVDYILTIRDTVTGALRTYYNPYGRLASVADTSAFGANGAGATTARTTFATDMDDRFAAELYGLYAVPTRTAAAAACTPGGTTLCLNQSRFQLTVDWAVPDRGQSGQGIAVPLTGDTGYFWFFNDGNVELVIKVLDARQINGHFWVFYGALSNVEYTITVTDTQTGAVRTYANPSGTLASFADTHAF